MKLSRLSSALVILSAIALSSCLSAEQRAVQTYVEASQDIAERLTAAATEFEALMEAQSDPLVWTDDAKAHLAANLATFQALYAETDTMAVPPAFEDIHPLLVASLGDMSAAVEIIDGIAKDPTTASIEKGDEMTAKATSAEALANEYVDKLQETLETKYPEMMEER